MVKDSTSSYKIDYVIVIKNFLNPEGHQNSIIGSKVTEGVDFAYWWSFIGKGLRLQPAQQACFFYFPVSVSVSKENKVKTEK